jgi:GT2 family glycosyltransferase
MSRVAVAISAFRSDALVISLLERIQLEQWPIERTIVVDSLGTGKIAEFIKAKDLQEEVTYFNFQNNLGSAGNLCKRLELCAEQGFDFALALNHDAIIHADAVRALLEETQQENLGALYCLRFLEGKGIYDLTGQKEAVWTRGFGPIEKPKDALIEVLWGSSNMTLYSMDPIRKQVKPDPSLWMGWEDYLYGIQLRNQGYKQFVVTAAETRDQYEYKQVNSMGLKMTLSEKPVWYFYYRARNLVLIACYRSPSLYRIVGAFLRLIAETFALILGWEKKQPLKAFAYLLLGSWHGLLNKSGKWKKP